MIQKVLSTYKNAFANLQGHIWLLALASFINRSGSIVLLFTSLYLTNELHFSIATAGYIMSAYGFGSVLGSFTGGWLADRMHFFKLMVWSLVVSGFILFGFLFTQNPYLIGAIIFLHSFFADIFRPANAKAMSAYSTTENRTRSVSLVRLAINLGFSVGPAIGGFIAISLGYHWLFVLDAMTSFGAAVLLYVYLPRQVDLPAKTESEILTDGKSISAYKDFRYLVFIVLVALYATCFFQLFASVPQYFSKICGYKESEIGLLLALNGFVVVVFEMPIIAWLEPKGKIFKCIIAGVLCIPVAFFMLLLGEGSLILAILYTLIITLSEILAMPFMMNYSLSKPSANKQGEYFALYAMAYGIATITAPSIGLGIAERIGFEMMFASLGVLCFFVAGGFIVLERGEGRPS